jgi:ABC-type multidrug transport system ATPase subunit
MTGREVVAFAAQLAGVSLSERPNRVEETLGRVGLTGAASDRVATYSSPLRRRLGLAQAIVGRPNVVLLDEPVASLAGPDRDELLGLVATLSPEATVLYTTAEIADIERVADRVALLDAGRLVLEAPVTDVLDELPAVYAIEADRDQAPLIASLDARLRQEPWVAWTTIEAAGLRVAVSEPARASRDLLPLVVAAAVRVAGFGRRRPTLEDLLAERSRRGPPRDRAA